MQVISYSIGLLKLFSTPIVCSIFLLALGLVLMRNIKLQAAGKLGWYAIFTGTLMIFLLSVSPIGNLLVYSLEREYAPISNESLSNLDIIAILGGGIYPSGELSGFYEPSGITYSRVCNGVDLFKRSSAKLLVLCGAAPGLEKQSEAEVMARLAIRLGVPQEKLIVESRSKNTKEHVEEFERIFPPVMKKKIGIVTSALHMSRSCNAFWRKYSKEYIVPIPVNYFYSAQGYSLKSLIPSVETFQISCYAIHELVGKVWYLFTAT